MSEPNFEQAIEELDRILRELEESGGPLEESLKKYGRGVELVALCTAKLNHVEQSIRQLTSVDADGNPVLTPFGHTPSGSEAPAKKKKQAPG